MQKHFGFYVRRHIIYLGKNGRYCAVGKVFATGKCKAEQVGLDTKNAGSYFAINERLSCRV